MKTCRRNYLETERAYIRKKRLENIKIESYLLWDKFIQPEIENVIEKSNNDRLFYEKLSYRIYQRLEIENIISQSNSQRLMYERLPSKIEKEQYIQNVIQKSDTIRKNHQITIDKIKSDDKFYQDMLDRCTKLHFLSRKF